MSSVDMYCLLLVVSGLAVVYWGKRRGFIRLNQLGIEQFSSYGQRVVSKLIDGTILVTGYGCIGGAILVLLIEHMAEYIVLAVVLYIAFVLDEEWYRRRR